MTLNETRIKECFWLLGCVLPVGEEHKEKLTKLLGSNYNKVIDDLMKVLAELATSNKEVFDGYLDFIQESIDYMREDSDEMPRCDAPREEYENFVKSMRMELEKNKEKNAA